jgi:hypothetical protein
MEPKRLKLGLLTDSYLVPAWIYSSIERIILSDCAEFALAIIHENNIKQRKEPRQKNQIIPRIFNALDEKIFVRRNSATALKNIEDILKGIDTLKVSPTREKNGLSLSPADIEIIHRYALDLLIKVGFGELHGDILTSSKYGIWEYFGETEPHGFWEVMEGISETWMSLRALEEGHPNGKILYTCSSSTYPFSPTRNRNHSLWKSSSYLPRKLNSLFTLGEADFFHLAESYHETYLHNLKKRPVEEQSSLKQLWLVSKLLVKNIGEIIWRRISLDAWFLMFDLHEEDSFPFKDYTKVVPPKYLFWADPHVIQKENNYYVFIEEFESRKGKGRISVLNVDPFGHYTEPVPVLEKEYHLSYPCVFEWNDRYYMVPESSANRTIDLYECIQFPEKWAYKMTLMENINAVDTTLFYYQSKWWLFTGISENEGSSPEVELFLYYSDDLFTKEWKAHPLNPLKSNARDSRPAGGIFLKDGKLFRPSQDCSTSYGYSFDLNEILELSETNYAERWERSIKPDWDKKVLGTHTFGVQGKFKIIDAYSTKTRFSKH